MKSGTMCENSVQARRQVQDITRQAFAFMLLSNSLKGKGLKERLSKSSLLETRESVEPDWVKSDRIDAKAVVQVCLSTVDGK